MKTPLLSELKIKAPNDLDPDQTTYGFLSETDGKEVYVENHLKHQPAGIVSAAIKANIKYPDIYDLTLVKLPRPGPAAGMFTRSRSASPAVQIDRENLTNGRAQALVVISKNANVFTPTAREDCEKVIAAAAEQLGVAPADVLISCTGVIGVSLPVAKALAGIAQYPVEKREGLIDEVSQAILTTDRGPKVGSVKIGDMVLCGMAKGAGMIEPNMATMLVYFFTNLNLSQERLNSILREVTDCTFNSISVDSDTSTSDSLVLMSTGEVSPTPKLEADFRKALLALSSKLSREVVYQAEGASKLIEARVRGAASNEHARQLAKHIINSPLIKTAVFGADPNWGRVVMAIGKPQQERTGQLDPAKVRIGINGYTLFEYSKAVPQDLNKVSTSIRDLKVIGIDAELGEGSGEWVAWGCDLGYEYVKINAEYTT